MFDVAFDINVVGVHDNRIVSFLRDCYAIDVSETLISRACPVCAASGNRPQWEKGDLRIVKCPTCSMVYANPVQSKYASGDYYDQSAAAYYLSPQKLVSDYSPVRFSRELKIFRKFSPSGSVLDVGCSTGGFLFQLKNQFSGDYQVLGADASGPALDHAEQQGVPVVRGDFLQQDFQDQKFDAVTLWAVLEHLLDPGAFLAKASSVLKPQGHCFVLVPNLDSFAQRFLGIKYRYVYPQHLNYFSAQTLRLLAQKHFSITSVAYTHFNPVIIWQDWKSGGQDQPNEARGALLERTTKLKTNPRLKLLRPLYAAAEKALSAAHLADNLVMVLQKSRPGNNLV
jgi:2-polyprenyl-3-methyl-5-hydroxy-6-metoxy-1,4-benzoquinol methylase